ncbi:Two component regulator propeller [Zhouia amylolytica]|uniref:Two component regulator propeller n=2 Tax=Zhouia amylolytica TaxID=376730 RepID=A0A1I6TUF6_9FLAO|nr:Two component regulator propeller [Zhouia amylolytica]
MVLVYNLFIYIEFIFFLRVVALWFKTDIYEFFINHPMMTLNMKLLRFLPLWLFFLGCKDNTSNKISEVPPVKSSTTDHNNSLPLMFEKEATDTLSHATFNGVITEFVWQIYQDNQGHFWFGTNHNGVLYYDHKLLRQFTSQHGVGGSAVRAIIEDKEGTIWLGTSEGLTSYNGKSFTNYTVTDGLANDEVWTLAIDKSGTLWVGTVGGVSTFDGNQFETFKVDKAKVSDPKPMLSENRISDILIDLNDHIWFVTDGYGISKYDGKGFEFFTVNNGLPDNHVADLLQDHEGNIWIGTYYGGVSKYDGRKFINFTKDGLIQGIEAYNFLEDSEGNIWFSAENHGVYRYDGKQFVLFTTKDGLATNGIQSIYQDKKGQIWFSTWNGLSLYDGKNISNAALKEPWVQ